MNARQRQILTDVAEGRLRPEEAAALLDAASDAAAGQAAGRPGIGRLRVAGTFRLVTVVGDRSVREAAVADGPHAARREGDTLVLENEPDEDGWPGFAFTGADRRWRFPAPPGPDAGWAAARPRPLTVRMRPDLPLEVDLSAGMLRVDGVTGPIRVELAAGSARLDGVRGPLDVRVSAGSLRVAGVLDRGASTVHCEAGSVRVHLEPGSSVHVRARAELGRIALPDQAGPASWMVGAGTREATVGGGAASLDVDAAMGTVTVSADR
jgi:hypothetical protein